jgi:hypothetical protein
VDADGSERGAKFALFQGVRVRARFTPKALQPVFTAASISALVALSAALNGELAEACRAGIRFNDFAVFIATFSPPAVDDRY